MLSETGRRCIGALQFDICVLVLPEWATLSVPSDLMNSIGEGILQTRRVAEMTLRLGWIVSGNTRRLVRTC